MSTVNKITLKSDTVPPDSTMDEGVLIDERTDPLDVFDENESTEEEIVILTTCDDGQVPSSDNVNLQVFINSPTHLKQEDNSIYLPVANPTDTVKSEANRPIALLSNTVQNGKSSQPPPLLKRNSDNALDLDCPKKLRFMLQAAKNCIEEKDSLIEHLKCEQQKLQRRIKTLETLLIGIMEDVI